MNILGENGLFNGASVEEVGMAALFWGESINGEKGGEILIIMKATVVSLLVLLIFGLLAKLKLVRYSSSSSLNDSIPSSCTSTTNSNKLNDSVPSCPTTTNSNNHPNLTSEIISSADLKSLVEDLDDTNLNKDDGQLWEIVVEKRNSLIAYQAKSCKPKNGPLKYLSVTTFENCSAERLRDFYMDNDYRKKWDKTVVDHEQLQVDKSNNTEIGRMIKKFPLLTSREYVLAWRVWESKDESFYCLSKECEHPSAPRQKKYVRVKFFRSGWCIRKVPGRNASEIRMIHQEDAGLNVEMAKLAFSKGIWSYVVKTDDALRKYLEKYNSQLSLGDTGITLTQKVTQKATAGLNTLPNASIPATNVSIRQKASEDGKTKCLITKPRREVIKNGLIVLGGVICLSRGHSSLGAKVAMAYILTKLSKRNGTLSLPRQPK